MVFVLRDFVTAGRSIFCGEPSTIPPEDAFAAYLCAEVHASITGLVATLSSSPSQPWAGGHSGHSDSTFNDSERVHRLRARALSEASRDGSVEVDMLETSVHDYLDRYASFLSLIVSDLLELKQEAIKKCAALDTADASWRRERRQHYTRVLRTVGGSEEKRLKVQEIVEDENEADEARMQANRLQERVKFEDEHPCPLYKIPHPFDEYASPSVTRWVEAERHELQAESLRLLGL